MVNVLEPLNSPGKPAQTTATTSQTTALTTSQTTAGVEPKTAPQLSIRVARARTDARSFIAHQYATYPFRLSGNLRLDARDSHRAYTYVMNASPGILSGDDLRWAVEVGDRACLYLTDQSATKVHSQPREGTPARMTYDFTVGAGAYLEYIPEPIILFRAANLTQRTHITLHPAGTIVLSEIMVPGRLARGEFYEFEQFLSRLQVHSPDGTLCFADNVHLFGASNRFSQSPIFSELTILGNFVVVVPGVDLAKLAQMLEDKNHPELQMCSSPLPGCHGLLVRAMATQVSLLTAYQRYLLGCVRQLTGHSPLPLIPK